MEKQIVKVREVIRKLMGKILPRGIFKFVESPLWPFYIFFFIFLLTEPPPFFPLLYANNLKITNVALAFQDTNVGTATIQFDISWDNSWRDSLNYDAVWVFIKYSSDQEETWGHATLKRGGINPLGFGRGTGVEVDIIVPPDRKGCFIQRASMGSGRVEVKGIQVVWDYKQDNVDAHSLSKIGLKIFGIEMVYIPEGAFFAGDNQASPAAFDQGSAPQEKDPWYIQSEGAIYVENTLENGYYYNSGGNIGENSSGDEFVIPASFPKGFSAFYIMKYEITQGQYADFLNTLTPLQSARRYPDQYGNYRYTIHHTDSGYIAERPYRACNYLSWMDLCAYADWSALRPMTELEFEKAARGKDIFPKEGELSWGTTSITPATTIVGAEDGTETVANIQANCVFGNQTFSGGDGGNGPLRVGIFATSTSTRQLSGGSYYGVMELSGNVWEHCVTVGNATGRAFQGGLGDGVLETASGYEGNATNPDWPGYVKGQGVEKAIGSGFKGGSWLETDISKLAISDRSEAARISELREPDAGGRCVRDSP